MEGPPFQMLCFQNKDKPGKFLKKKYEPYLSSFFFQFNKDHFSKKIFSFPIKLDFRSGKIVRFI